MEGHDYLLIIPGRYVNVWQNVTVPASSNSCYHQLTKRGYEYFMRSQDDKLGLVMFRLFNRLGVFETWPEFLLKEKRDMAKQKYKNRSLAEDTQSEQLWKAAYEGLRRWQDLDDRFPYRDNDAMLAALFKRSF